VYLRPPVALCTVWCTSKSPHSFNCYKQSRSSSALLWD